MLKHDERVRLILQPMRAAGVFLHCLSTATEKLRVSGPLSHLLSSSQTLTCRHEVVVYQSNREWKTFRISYGFSLLIETARRRPHCFCVPGLYVISKSYVASPANHRCPVTFSLAMLVGCYQSSPRTHGHNKDRKSWNFCLFCITGPRTPVCALGSFSKLYSLSVAQYESAWSFQFLLRYLLVIYTLTGQQRCNCDQNLNFLKPKYLLTMLNVAIGIYTSW